MSNIHNLPFIQLLNENSYIIVSGYIGGCVSLSVISYVMTFFKYEIMRALNQKLMIQEE